MLYHVSDQPGIERFEPRPSAYTDEPVVWALHETRLQNYLLPRDCPRVTFYAGPNTSSADVERFLGSSRSVVAFESIWLDRVRSGRLFRYHMSEVGFECIDECAGHFVSRATVVPEAVDQIDDLLGALQAREVEIRVLPSLWALRDAVVDSTLQFSIIRMRNASPRDSDLTLSDS